MYIVPKYIQNAGIFKIRSVLRKQLTAIIIFTNYSDYNYLLHSLIHEINIIFFNTGLFYSFLTLLQLFFKSSYSMQKTMACEGAGYVNF